jgi:hypothetical protein
VNSKHAAPCREYAPQVPYRSLHATAASGLPTISSLALHGAPEGRGFVARMDRAAGAACLYYCSAFNKGMICRCDFVALTQRRCIPRSGLVALLGSLVGAQPHAEPPPWYTVAAGAFKLSVTMLLGTHFY